LLTIGHSIKILHTLPPADVTKDMDNKFNEIYTIGRLYFREKLHEDLINANHIENSMREILQYATQNVDEYLKRYELYSNKVEELINKSQALMEEMMEGK
jgi:endonuclease III